MGEIRIGKFLLPYYHNEDIYAELPEEFYEFQSKADYKIGCILCYDKDCFNNGHCLAPEITYKCDCPRGFNGNDCSVDINECETHECKNSAICLDKIGEYECLCGLGYEGK